MNVSYDQSCTDWVIEDQNVKYRLSYGNMNQVCCKIHCCDKENILVRWCVTPHGEWISEWDTQIKHIDCWWGNDTWMILLSMALVMASHCEGIREWGYVDKTHWSNSMLIKDLHCHWFGEGVELLCCWRAIVGRKYECPCFFEPCLLRQQWVHPLVPVWFGFNFNGVIYKYILMTDIIIIPCETGLRWMPEDTID